LEALLPVVEPIEVHPAAKKILGPWHVEDEVETTAGQGQEEAVAEVISRLVVLVETEHDAAPTTDRSTIPPPDLQREAQPGVAVEVREPGFATTEELEVVVLGEPGEELRPIPHVARSADERDVAVVDARLAAIDRLMVPAGETTQHERRTRDAVGPILTDQPGGRQAQEADVTDVVDVGAVDPCLLFHPDDGRQLAGEL